MRIVEKENLVSSLEKNCRGRGKTTHPLGEQVREDCGRRKIYWLVEKIIHPLGE